MPQIAIIQTAPAQAPIQTSTAGTSSSASSEDFATHLSNAVGNKKESKISSSAADNSSAQDISSVQDINSTDAKDSSIAASDDANSNDSGQSFSVAAANENSAIPATNEAALAAAITSPITIQSANAGNTAFEASFFYSFAAKMLAQETDSGALDQEQLTQLVKAAAETTTKGLTVSTVTGPTTNGANNINTTNVSTANFSTTNVSTTNVNTANFSTANFSTANFSTANFSTANFSTSIDTTNNSVLLAKLQQIIDNSSETGTVSIKNVQTGMNSKFAEQSTVVVQTSLNQPQAALTATSGKVLGSTLTVNIEGLQNQSNLSNQSTVVVQTSLSQPQVSVTTTGDETLNSAVTANTEGLKYQSQQLNPEGLQNQSNLSNQSTVTVQTSLSQPQVSVTTTGDETLSGAVTVNTDSLQNVADTAPEQLASQRQSTQQQYYDAKLAMDTEGSETEGEMQQQNSNNNSSGQLQSGQQLGQSTFSSSETSGAFSVNTQAPAQLNTTPTVDSSTATLSLSSGNMISESEVLQQITERFQVSQKTLDSQINIKLHPAELGELKIDLTVKDGSIRAHVIAQSQQVQQVLEKNMSRLKETLTEQGFTIDEITVATQSDSVGDFDLFDGELAQQNEYVPQSSQSTKMTGKFLQPDEFAELITGNETGVNLTI